MNLFRSFARVPLPGCGLLLQRAFGSTPVALREKYFKITKYAKPIDTAVYHAGEELPRRTIPKNTPQVPDYAFETMFFKRQNRGLYAGAQRKRSKTCSESKNKNLLFHLPNIVKTKLWSETLNRRVKTRASTKLLRTVTKEGGLDKYLLKDKPARIKTMGLKGWKLKYEIMKAKEMQDNSVGSASPVYHVTESGRKLLVRKSELLEILYPLEYRNNYEPIARDAFMRSHEPLSTDRLVEKLEQHNFDFSTITA